MLNNVFGRAAQPPKLRVELQNDRAGTRRARVLRVLTAGTPWCCKYLGRRASLQACIAAAEAEPRLGVTSVTWHRGAAGTDDWERTCYAIVDGTWQPVPVGPGQAKADSARAVGNLRLSPILEFATPWVDDMVVHMR